MKQNRPASLADGRQKAVEDYVKKVEDYCKSRNLAEDMPNSSEHIRLKYVGALKPTAKVTGKMLGSAEINSSFAYSNRPNRPSTYPLD
ncbi:hypothetical protein [Spirosoma endbachense]|uniref:Uncharacterized protein n=1 Tax=Spirosoma endbachense TaxID=2666025 RepID=A0A6P1W377_9BACT|nr:hypothetical protein [Spirosoma endbachense]QHV98156.1 hypothetical protein GJR95_25520 [Spirosoma endbachense]